MEPRLSLFGSISPNDLEQGSVGNCWLISALAAAAEFPDILTSRCKQQTISHDGQYLLEVQPSTRPPPKTLARMA